MRSPRLTIRRLMLIVVAAAWVSWLVASILKAQGFAVAMAYFSVLAAIALSPWAALRGRRRLAWRIFAISSAVECVAVGLMGIFTANFMYVVYKMMISMILLPLAAGSGAAWASLATAPGAERRRPRVAAWSLVALLLVLPASMIFSRWPMRAAFLVSRPALDRLADRVAAGEKVSGPQWAGLVRVTKINRSVDAPGYVGLIVDVHCWLVRTDSAQVAPKVPSPAFDTDPLGDGGRWWFSEYF